MKYARSLFCLFCLVYAAGPVVAAGDPDKIMIRVDGVQLRAAGLDALTDEQFKPIEKMVPGNEAAAMRAKVRNRAAQEFILSTLLDNEAVKRGLEVPPMEAEKMIADTLKRLPPGMTLEASLALRGTTRDAFEARLKREARIQKLIKQEVDKAGPPTDADLAAYYEAHKADYADPELVTARTIMINVKDSDDPAARAAKRARIDSLREQLLAGGDFAKLAKQHSDCPSGKDGGNLGNLRRGQMLDAVEDVVFSQKVKEIGPVIDDGSGYSIFQVLKKTPARTRPLAESRNELLFKLGRSRSQELVSALIATLLKQASVLVDPELELNLKDVNLFEKPPR
jgi:parvulin-like peptidyl-prolyl isomerase